MFRTAPRRHCGPARRGAALRPGGALSARCDGGRPAGRRCPGCVTEGLTAAEAEGGTPAAAGGEPVRGVLPSEVGSWRGSRRRGAPLRGAVRPDSPRRAHQRRNASRAHQRLRQHFVGRSLAGAAGTPDRASHLRPPASRSPQAAAGRGTLLARARAAAEARSRRALHGPDSTAPTDTPTPPGTRARQSPPPRLKNEPGRHPPRLKHEPAGTRAPPERARRAPRRPDSTAPTGSPPARQGGTSRPGRSGSSSAALRGAQRRRQECPARTRRRSGAGARLGRLGQTLGNVRATGRAARPAPVAGFERPWPVPSSPRLPRPSGGDRHVTPRMPIS